MYGLNLGDSLLTYEENPTRSTLRKGVELHVNDSARNKARLKSVISYKDVGDVLENLQYRLQNTTIDIKDYDDHYGIKLERTIERSDLEGGERPVTGRFALYRMPESNVWTAVTGYGSDFFERGIKWIFKQAEPHISNFYVTSVDLWNVLDTMREQIGPGTSIIAEKAVAYSHREEGTISFETKPYHVIFNESDNKGRYVDKIRFKVERHQELLFKGFLSRNGVSQFISGDTSYFFDHLIPTYTEFGQDKAEVFKDKERSPGTGELHEIELEFEEPVFKTPDDNKYLIEALGNLRSANVTVYHSNPYAHLSVLDIIDGSNCDVFVTDSSTIRIVPGYKSSMNSLMRVSDQIAREVDEGVVRESPTRDYEFSDFFETA